MPKQDLAREQTLIVSRRDRLWKLIVNHSASASAADGDVGVEPTTGGEGPA